MAVHVGRDLCALELRAQVRLARVDHYEIGRSERIRSTSGRAALPRAAASTPRGDSVEAADGDDLRAGADPNSISVTAGMREMIRVGASEGCVRAILSRRCAENGITTKPTKRTETNEVHCQVLR